MQSRTVKIVVDKPFVFALRDRQSGLILLSGYVGRIPGKPVES
jgi:serine protease inhibitor